MTSYSFYNLRMHQAAVPPLCSLTPEEAQEIHETLDAVYPDSDTYKRYAAILYLAQGQTIDEVASALHIQPIKVSQHLTQFEEARLSGLRAMHQRFLSDPYQTELQQELDSPGTNAIIRDRCYALLEYSKGKSARQIARELTRSEDTIQRYIRLYTYGRLRLLKPGFFAKQREEVLSPAQIDEIHTCLASTKPYSQLYRHLHSILLWDQNLSMDEIRDEWGLPSGSLKKVVALYHQEGLDALLALKEKINFDLLVLNLTAAQRRDAEHWMQTDISSLERARIQMVLRFDEGHSIRDIATDLKYAENTVERTIALFLEEGWQALRTLPKERQKKVKEVAQFEKSGIDAKLTALLSDLPEDSPKQLPYQIVQLYFSGLSGKEVAERLQCGVAIVYKSIQRYNEGGLLAFEETPTYFHPPQLADEIMEQLEIEIAKLPEGNKTRRQYEAIYLYGKGTSKLQIARQLTMDVNTVRRYIQLFTDEGLLAFQRPKTGKRAK